MTREMWPSVLCELAELIGEELTLELARREGGLDHIYIPYTHTTEHPWAVVVGEDAWRKIVGAWGGQRIDLPRGMFLQPKKLAILELVEQGLTNRAIARQVGVSAHYVRYVRRLARSGEAAETSDPRQLPLFHKG